MIASVSLVLPSALAPKSAMENFLSGMLGSAGCVGNARAPDHHVIRTQLHRAGRVAHAAGGVALRVDVDQQNPLFRDLYHGYYRYRTGALSNPRVLVGLVSTVVALLLAGVASCGGLLAGMQSGIFGNN